MISICFQNRPDPLILPPAAQTEIILIKCKVQYYNEGTPRLLCIMSATEITDNTIAGYQPQHTGHFSQSAGGGVLCCAP